MRIETKDDGSIWIWNNDETVFVRVGCGHFGCVAEIYSAPKGSDKATKILRPDGLILGAKTIELACALAKRMVRDYDVPSY